MKTLRIYATIAAMVLLSSTGLFSQDKSSSFTRYNYYEAGGEFGLCLSREWERKVGGYFIVGRQSSATSSIGLGIGLDYYRDKSGDVTVTVGDGTVKKYKQYRYSIPVFADYRYNFSNCKDPFYLNLRAGGVLGFSDSDLDDGGLVGGVGVGKAFNAGDVTISPYVRADFNTMFATGSGCWIEPLIVLGVNLRF